MRTHYHYDSTYEYYAYQAAPWRKEAWTEYSIRSRSERICELITTCPRCALSHRTDGRTTFSGSQPEALGQSSTRLFFPCNASHSISSIAAIRVFLERRYPFNSNLHRHVSSKPACSLIYEASPAQEPAICCCSPPSQRAKRMLGQSWCWRYI